MKAAVLICGHGSRDPDAVAEFEQTVAGLRARLPAYDVEFGSLEFARPTLRDGVDALAARGARRILALPLMLFAAGHVRNDLPAAIDGFKAGFPQIEMQLGRELSIEPRLVKAIAARIEEGERHGARDIPRGETLLLVIGRGTTDPAANATIGRLARMLGEEMGFGATEIGYAGTAAPLPEPALRQAVARGFKRIVVFPYFLFTGVLVKRVYAACDRVAADHPEIEILQAPYLRDHPLVLDCLADRVIAAMPHVSLHQQ
jgi:sirohydrochlorin cobaltochelatase